LAKCKQWEETAKNSKKGKDIRKKRYLAAVVFCSFSFWGEVSSSLILNDIDRKLLAGK
jgi:hypothetical protein